HRIKEGKSLQFALLQLACCTHSRSLYHSAFRAHTHGFHHGARQRLCVASRATLVASPRYPRRRLTGSRRLLARGETSSRGRATITHDCNPSMQTHFRERETGVMNSLKALSYGETLP